MFQQVLDKGDVGRHAPDAEFTQGAVHPGNRRIGGLRMGGDLDQKTVVIARDHAAGIGRAAVKADAHAGGLAEGGDAAVIGDEIVLRVLGRDPGLQGVTVEADILLRGFASRLGQGLALSDADLRLHDVDIGDLFGDRMFDLHTRVHFDEVELTAVHIHQEFDRAGTFIIDVLADLVTQLANFFALFGAQVGGRGAFHDLLVAALDRAVALEEVVHVAMFVAQDLHLDMAGAQDHFLQVAFAIAKGRFGLATAFEHLFFQLFGLEDRAHAAATTAPACLEHERIADLFGLAADFIHVVAQNLGRGDDRHTGLDRDAPRAGLVAEGAHGLGLGADEGDAVGDAGIDEIGVFAEQAIAGMDRIGTAFLRHANDLVDAEIGGDRPHAFADAIGFVRLEAVQAELVLFGENGDGTFAHLVGGAHDANGDLAPVGNQDFLEVCHWLIPCCPKLSLRDGAVSLFCCVAAPSLPPCKICVRFVQCLCVTG